MKKSLAALGCTLLMATSAAFAAVPTLQQVEQSMMDRDWSRADAQLTEVLSAHPNSAHAHYLYAQVLDREGRAADALAQLQRAQQIDPQRRFTDPSHFAQTEARIRADAGRASGGSSGGTQAAPSIGTQGAQSIGTEGTPAAMPAAEHEHHGLSAGMWVGLGLIVAAIAFVLRWTLRRARSTDDRHADDERRAQLKRATDVLNAVRPLKLDARLSTAPGAAALTGELDGIETQARELVEALSSGRNPVPPYRVDELERQLESAKARVEGRPDPNAQPAAPAGGSVYAQEADRLGGAPGQAYPPGQQPYPPGQPYQQQPVVIQQQPGIGAGVGGLLGGMMLGEMMGGHDRVVERDVIVDDQRHKQNGDQNVDVGRGDGNNWNDNNDGGGSVDFGSSDDSGGWTDT